MFLRARFSSGSLEVNRGVGGGRGLEGFLGEFGGG